MPLLASSRCHAHGSCWRFITNEWPTCHGPLSRMATQIALPPELWAKFSSSQVRSFYFLHKKRWKTATPPMQRPGNVESPIQTEHPASVILLWPILIGKESNPRKSLWLLLYMIPKLNSNLQNYTCPNSTYDLHFIPLESHPPINNCILHCDSRFFFRFPGHINAIGGKVAPSHRSKMHVPFDKTGLL